MRAALLGYPIVLGTLVLAFEARADARACSDALDRGQARRSEGKLLEATKMLLGCDDPACPPLVRQECSRVMGEAQAAIPSVIVGARDAKGDVVDARVTIDGVRSTSLDGRPIRVDPGPRTIRFERTDGSVAETRVLLREGEKNRHVDVTFTDTSTMPNARDEAQRSTIPTSFWIVGGASVALLGSGLYFDLSALEQSSCRPHCGDEGASEIRTKAYLAYGLLGAGAIAGVAAAIIFLTRPASSTGK